MKSTTSQANAMQETLRYEGLLNTINNLPALPSLPTVYTELTEAIKDENVSLTLAGDIIEQDIALSAKILQLVNSAAFGLAQSVNSPAQAAAILGLETLKALTLTTSVFQEFDGHSEIDFSLSNLMDHSLQVANCAKTIAQLEGLQHEQEEEVFTAGMLHDIGKLLLATSDTEAFAETRRLVRDERISEFEAERRIYGADHAAAGAYLLDSWGLPQSIVEIVGLHHRPQVETGGELSALTTVWAANLLCHDADDEQLERHLCAFATRTNLAAWREACTRVDESR